MEINNFKNFFLKLSSVFLSLLPFTLIVGPAAADINISLISLLFLIIIFL